MRNRKIIVLNLGSTSFKFKLFFFGAREKPEASGSFENIGSKMSEYSIRLRDKTLQGTCHCTKHTDAFRITIDILAGEKVLESMKDLDAVGYKAVHAGTLTGARVVDESLLLTMEKYKSFAPAHNPVYMDMMMQIGDEYPGLLQIAYFETSFHQSIPLKRAVYGVPYEWVEELGIRRYGFHGSSHGYIAEKMCELEPKAGKIISLHLGGSSSVCAIYNGKSIASSMGATPQSGLFHNNRVGDFDIFCLSALINRMNGDLEQVMNALSKQSGFLGLSGISNDLREVLSARERGDFRASLAVDAYVDNIVGYIGMFSAYLKGMDAIVFTGGIGYNSDIIRSLVCDELAYLGLFLDEDKNRMNKGGKISSENSSILVYCLETNEELMVARKCNELLDGLMQLSGG